MAIVAMLLFGLHSIHLESVAWVTERKDLLYSLFYLAGLNLYLEYLSQKKIKFFILLLLAFVFSLLSKAMAVSLPFILILIDLYKSRKLFSKKVILEKIPFFLTGALWGVLTLYWHNQYGSMANSTGFLFTERILLGAKGFVFYLSHILLPLNLAVFHPVPESFSTTLLLESLFYIVVILVAFVWLFMKREKYKIVFFGFGFFIFTLFLFLIPPGVPVIASERYAYISSIGIFIVLAYGYDYLIIKFKGYKFLVQILLAAYLIFLGVNTFQMAKSWENSLTLWNRVINVHGEIFYPLQQLGIANRLDKNYEAAINDFNVAIKLNPNFYRTYEQRGYVYSLMGNYNSAEKDFTKALDLNPESHTAWSNLGFIYRQQKDYTKALSCLDKAISIKSSYVDAYIIRAKVYNLLEEFDKACYDLRTAKSKFPTKQQIEIITKIQEGLKCGKEQETSYIKHSDCDALSLNPAQWLAIKQH